MSDIIINVETNAKEQAAQLERLGIIAQSLVRTSKTQVGAYSSLSSATNKATKSSNQFARSVEQQAASLKRTGDRIQYATNQYGTYNVAAQRSAQSTKRFASVGLQQAGYQIGDFIVQVQSGQSALVAFGQQGSQLAGIFGPAGAVVGALIAAGTALGMIYQATKEAREGTKGFAEDLKSLKEELKEVARETAALEQGFLNVGQAAIQNELNKAYEDLESALNRSGRNAGRDNARAEKVREEIQAIKDLEREYLEYVLEQEYGADVAERLLRTIDKIDFNHAIDGARDLGAAIEEAISKTWMYQAPDPSNGLSIVEQIERRARIGPSDPGLVSQTGLPESDYEPPKAPRSRRRRSSGASRQDPLERLRQRIKLETQLIGKTEAQQRMIRALGIEYENYSAKQIERVQTEIEGLLKVEEQQQRIIEAQETMASSATDLFLAAADSTDAFRESLSRMLRQLGEAIIQQAILNQLQSTSGGGAVSSVVGGIAGALGFADGGVFNKGKVIPFADGGVVTGPTTFPMAGATGLMGEAGPEAIMPLKRGKDGKLGVSSNGGTTVVKPTINIDARGAQQGVAEQINTQLTQALPTIIEATVSATRERNRRGAM